MDHDARIQAAITDLEPRLSGWVYRFQATAIGALQEAGGRKKSTPRQQRHISALSAHGGERG
jgi:hypothetical protein